MEISSYISSFFKDHPLHHYTMRRLQMIMQNGSKFHGGAIPEVIVETEIYLLNYVDIFLTMADWKRSKIRKPKLG